MHKLISRQSLVIAAAVVLFALLAGSSIFGKNQVAAVEPTDNIVVILTDDQRADTIWSMNKLQQRLVKNGVNFVNAFITTPICCPSRASLYSGGYYPKNTGVLTNTTKNGNVERYIDTNTIATVLQANGYKTAFFGKYLNGYDTRMAPTVPPGWTKFVALKDDNNWNNFSVIIGSSTTATTTGSEVQVTQYMTDYLREEAKSFIDQYNNVPFVIFIATKAPHAPATPSSSDTNLFNNFTYNPPSVGENNLNDKPLWVQQAADYEDATPFAKDQLRSLQAVDRLVDQVFQKLNSYSLITKTHIVFTSDNGYMWGEHGIQRKSKAYEESIRVPLVIRSPEVTVKPATSTLQVAANLDLGATILRWGGISTTTDGIDLGPILTNQASTSTWARESGIMFQNFGRPDEERYNPPLWMAWRTALYKLVEYPTTGEKEFYDLTNDPYEMVSKHNDSSFQTLISQYSANIAANDGLVITLSTTTLPNAQVSVPYSFTVPAVGGTTPYTWTKGNGAPPGLTLATSTGVISGTPTSAGTYDFDVTATDSSVSPQNGNPQTFTAYKVTITVNP